MESWDSLLPVSIVLVGCILLLLLISLILKLRDFDAISVRTETENTMGNKRVRILIIAVACRIHNKFYGNDSIYWISGSSHSIRDRRKG